MLSTARAPRPARLLAAVLAVAALAHLPLAAQTPDTRTMQPALDALLEALKQKNFDLLAPYLDESFHVGSLPGGMARQVLAQVVNGGIRSASALHVESATQDGANVKVSTRFEFAGGPQTLDVLFTPAGKIVDLPLFRVEMGGGSLPPGAQVRDTMRMGEAPQAEAAPAAPPRASNPTLRDEPLAMRNDQRSETKWRRKSSSGTETTPVSGSAMSTWSPRTA